MKPSEIEAGIVVRTVNRDFLLEECDCPDGTNSYHTWAVNTFGVKTHPDDEPGHMITADAHYFSPVDDPFDSWVKKVRRVNGR
jgi:hypothetical protein